MRKGPNAHKKQNRRSPEYHFIKPDNLKNFPAKSIESPAGVYAAVLSRAAFFVTG
jgi:hypothetical protein